MFTICKKGIRWGKLSIMQFHRWHFKAVRWCRIEPRKTICSQILLLSTHLLIAPLTSPWPMILPRTILVCAWIFGQQYIKTKTNNPRHSLTGLTVILDGGEDAHGCANLWAIRWFTLLLRSVTCPGCGILSPFKMCQLKQFLQHTFLCAFRAALFHPTISTEIFI